MRFTVITDSVTTSELSMSAEILEYKKYIWLVYTITTLDESVYLTTWNYTKLLNAASLHHTK